MASAGCPARALHRGSLLPPRTLESRGTALVSLRQHLSLPDLPSHRPRRSTGVSSRSPGPSAPSSSSSSASVGMPRAAQAAETQGQGQGLRDPRKENVAGDFYVDHTCIDCDTCRWMAPGVFSRAGAMSAVHRQPTAGEERLQALQALLACPTASIHTRTPPSDIHAAHQSFPLPVSPDLPGVYHCGFHSPKSFGATSYYVQAPGCNVLVDSPRYTRVLADRLEEMGGVDVLFLTHRDDVADHALWAERFGCARVMHRADIAGGTAAVEVQLDGAGPWRLPLSENPGGEWPTGTSPGAGPSGLTIVHTPGHSRGSCSLHYHPYPESPGVLFTGDHLALDEDDDSPSLTIFPRYCSHSLTVQRQSVLKLRPLPFRWILPGHGRRVHFASDNEKVQALSQV